MSDKRYTLTVYVAAPGTPLTKEDGSPKMKNGVQDHSLVGHVYYAIDDGTGKKGFGFAPLKEGQAFGQGDSKEDEFKTYQNPIYERTIEISEEQYDRLLAFRNNPKAAGFDTDNYSGLSNSCVDALYSALRYGKVHNFQKTYYVGDGTHNVTPITVNHDGYVTVEPNIENLKKIQPLPQYKNSELNKEIERPLPSCYKAFGMSWKTAVCSMADNSQSDFYQSPTQYAKEENSPFLDYLNQNPVTEAETRSFMAAVEAAETEQRLQEIAMEQSRSHGMVRS